ncbi:hypothetical protein EH244_06000 [Variovorax beijingensis]|uniref:Uncharacterized protein n=1 Tax=Variovorax beijingensis TaxID=2496117 RepID=A0A3P3EV70_9BURK|nr:hypothetical protein [Variovorax beijingensis]RRH90304.1 hypothetical protein EH244_06000 [Variovorax beijingensis]
METAASRIACLCRSLDLHRKMITYVAIALRPTPVHKTITSSLPPIYGMSAVEGIGIGIGIGMEDPVSKEADGIAFILDADIDRQDESALLAYLEKKYVTAPLMKFDLGYLSAAIRVASDQPK